MQQEQSMIDVHHLYTMKNILKSKTLMISIYVRRVPYFYTEIIGNYILDILSVSGWGRGKLGKDDD